MNRPTLQLASLLVLITACVPISPYEQAIKELPEFERNIGNLRLKDCDRLWDAISPMEDEGNAPQQIGVGFGVESIEFKNAVSAEAYLAALLQSIRSCREWATLETSSSEFNDSFLRFASVATDTLAPEKSDETLRLLLDIHQALQQMPKHNSLANKSLEEFTVLVSQYASFEERISENSRLIDELGDNEGQAGAEGAAGKAGATGTPGQSGSAGTQGGTGATGTAGEAGSTGRPGSNGDKGAGGASADFPTSGGSYPRGLTLSFSFDTNSSVPKPIQVSRARAKISEFDTDCQNLRGSIVGFADTRGSASDNAALSIERANAIATELRLDDVEVIRAGGAGETERFGDRLVMNRTVEVALWCAT